MVSLDPSRDTPEVLADYVPYFHEDFIGVTGEFLTIRRFAPPPPPPLATVPQRADYPVAPSPHLTSLHPTRAYHPTFRSPFPTRTIQPAYRTPLRTPPPQP